MRAQAGLTEDTEWDRFDPMTPAGQWVAARREHLARPPRRSALHHGALHHGALHHGALHHGAAAVTVPDATGLRTGRPLSTQEAFGRILVDLSRDEAVAPYLVTAAPTWPPPPTWPASSTAPRCSAGRPPVLERGRRAEVGRGSRRAPHRAGHQRDEPVPAARPARPGLGPVRPAAAAVGTVYDPFVLRGLDAFIYSVYSGARFVVAGTPSGVTLAPEGGAHQSTITPRSVSSCPASRSSSLPTRRRWTGCCAARCRASPRPTPPRSARPGTGHRSWRTAPTTSGSPPGLDQQPFQAARTGSATRCCAARSWRGPTGWWMRTARDGTPAVHLAGSGAVMPEVLAAAAELAEEGIAAHVVDVTSADRLYRAWQRTLRQGVRTARCRPFPVPAQRVR